MRCGAFIPAGESVGDGLENKERYRLLVGDLALQRLAGCVGAHDFASLNGRRQEVGGKVQEQVRANEVVAGGA